MGLVGETSAELACGGTRFFLMARLTLAFSKTVSRSVSPAINKTFFPLLPSVVSPGASHQGLSIFLERCEASGTMALSLLWADLTTTYSAVTIKSCLPSQRCHRWNCACCRQVREFSSVTVIASVGSSRVLDAPTNAL